MYIYIYVYIWGCQETLCCKPRTLLFEGTGVPLAPRGCADGFLQVCRGVWISVDTNTSGITTISIVDTHGNPRCL